MPTAAAPWLTSNEVPLLGALIATLPVELTPIRCVPLLVIYVEWADVVPMLNVVDAKPASRAETVPSVTLRASPAATAVTVSAVPLLGAANTWFPALLTLHRSVELDASAGVLAAERYRPLVGTVEPVGTNAAAAADDSPLFTCSHTADSVAGITEADTVIVVFGAPYVDALMVP
jgi:hypothetical protein